MSMGRRRLKRMTPSGAAREPADDREPEDKERVREQRPDDRGLGDDELTGRDGKQDHEELGQVAERRLQHAGGRRAERVSPTVSVAIAITQARPASAPPETTKIATAFAPA